MRRASVVASAIAIWMLTMGVLIQSTPAEAGPNSFQYLDRFDTGTYNGNNGTDNYTGPWWENNDWGGTNNGLVTVESGGNCPNDRCAVISGDPFTFWGTGLYRWADTAGAEVVKIKFRYSVALQNNTNGYLNVGVFDGAAWNTVHTIWLNAHEDDGDDDVRTKTITVTQYAHEDFMVGFFAHEDWEATFHIDNVEVFGSWDSGATTTTTTRPPSTTTQPPTTTTAAPTTTTSTTSPPVTTTTSTPTTTTTTTAPTATTSTTSTTVVPGTTTVAPTTTVAALPPVTTVPPTTVAIVPAVPIQDDVRYNEKLALISANDGGEIMSLPAPQEEIVSPGPVTQIMASITTTAVTVRSHLLSAMALGLLIAVAAIWGLGKRESIA